MDRKKHSTAGEPARKVTFTTKEVAARLGVSEWEIRRLADEGYLNPLPGFRKPLRFSEYAIDQYLKSSVRV